MSDFTLFHMWEPFRQSLIKGHSFYVEQARKRLLSQFDDIEADADRVAKEWLAQNSRHFDPDRDDPCDYFMNAHDVGIEFYTLLSNMREQTRLSVVAGMFHEWEKQLRDWLVGEIRHWHKGDKATMETRKADFVKLAKLLQCFGWNLRSTDYFRLLEACCLVVNVYKHGDGRSLDDLNKSFPEYLDDPTKGIEENCPDLKYLKHTHLKVSDSQFQAFSDAILAFWRDVPEKVYHSQFTEIPDWFAKAIQRDGAENQQGSKK